MKFFRPKTGTILMNQMKNEDTRMKQLNFSVLNEAKWIYFFLSLTDYFTIKLVPMTM